ncbi:MAG: hypothetical protein H6737_02560 [Alphaproteobacteria bacterium]|nr:hypothetical protein [Alphaproteobacteria bacterium]
MTTRELRDPEEARDWLAAGLALVRVGRPGADTVREATPWLRAAASDTPALPPAGVLADLGRLLTQPGARPRQESTGPLARVLRSYEDQVLGRIAVDPLREAAFDAIAGLPARLRPVAIALFVEQVLDRVGFDEGTAIDPGALRDLDRKTGEEWVVRGSAALRADAAEYLQAAYAELVACFQRTGRPIAPGDIATLEQLELLEMRSQRLTLRQVVDAAAGLSRGLPKRMKPSRRRAGHVSTRLEDESAYPVGGFSSISTSGAMENLVTSELALMEDGPEIDLFDVRYAEGELLFYTRDETAFVRERRKITVVLDASIDTLRYRETGLPYQRTVLVLALVRALVEQLAIWLNRQELLVRVAFPPGVLREEAQVLTLATTEWREAGLVAIDTLAPAAIPALVEADARSAPTDVIWIGAEPHPRLDIPHTWQASFAAMPVPEVSGPFRTAYTLPDEPWIAWREATRKLLSDLV